MKQLRIWGRGGRFLAALALIVLFYREGTGSASAAQAQPATAGASARASQLSSEGQAWLLKAIDTGNSSDLRWPDFSDFRTHVKKLYEFNGYSLWWVRGWEPTAQARQLIALLRQADQKGLSAEDYDGSRWDARLAKLKPATRSQPKRMPRNSTSRLRFARCGTYPTCMLEM